MISEIRPRRLICLTGFMGSGKSTAGGLRRAPAGLAAHRSRQAHHRSHRAFDPRNFRPHGRAGIPAHRARAARARGGRTHREPEAAHRFAGRRHDLAAAESRAAARERRRAHLAAVPGGAAAAALRDRHRPAALSRRGQLPPPVRGAPAGLRIRPIIAWTAMPSLRAWWNRFSRLEFFRG